MGLPNRIFSLIVYEKMMGYCSANETDPLMATLPL